MKPGAESAQTRPTISAGIGQWAPSLIVGAWLSMTAVWPVTIVQIKFARVLWQPLLLLALVVLTGFRSRDRGWAKATGQSLWMFLVLTISGWLPYLRTTTYPIDYPYPRAYGVYLVAYEVGIAALVVLQAALAASGRSSSWWTADGWSRPLVVAPVLLVARGLQAGHWISPVVGVALGASLAALRPWRWITESMSTKLRRLTPTAVFLLGSLLVFGTGIRIYSQTGSNFPAASDDGPPYFQMALAMARDPGLFLTPRLGDDDHFSGYYPAMALWFMVAGPHIPSWLLWHGLAGGLLAVAAYGLGRVLSGLVCGAAAAALIVADRVTLHLLSTMNMETFFLPALYLAVLLWIQAGGEVGSRATAFSLASGILLGLATVFRPTSAFLPLAWTALLFMERPRPSPGALGREVRWMLAGFGLALIPMLLRHRIAWGYWTLAGIKGTVSSRLNYALEIDGQHLVDIGLGAWLRLVAADPSVIWRKVVPGWWDQGLSLWTHGGFGQMDLLRGLNHEGPYQAALTAVMAAAVLVGAAWAIRSLTRADLAMLSLLVYFTSLVLGFYVLNSRYRAPFIPALYLLSCVGFSLATTAKRPYP